MSSFPFLGWSLFLLIITSLFLLHRFLDFFFSLLLFRLGFNLFRFLLFSLLESYYMLVLNLNVNILIEFFVCLNDIVYFSK